MDKASKYRKGQDDFTQLKLTLVEQALQSNYTRKRLHHVSPLQLVNRLLLLFQRPRIFLFYRKEGDDWQYFFKTYQDVLFERIFQKTVMKRLHEERKSGQFYVQPPPSRSLTYQWPVAPDPIGKTGFGVILVSAEQRTLAGRILFAPVNPEEYLLLSRLWDSFLGSEYSKVLGVEERLKARLQQFSDDPAARKLRIPEINETECKLEAGDREIIDKQLELLNKIIEKIYKELCTTAPICNKGKIPPNIFFFLRYYDAPETVNRFENGLKRNRSTPYPYSLRIIIPPTQRQHLLETLENIRKSPQTNSGLNTGRWTYKFERMKEFRKVFPRLPRQVEHACFPNEELDRLFWDKVQNEAYEEILNDIQAPFERDARSMVDPTLMSGYTHYRPGLFSEAGEERIRPQVKNQGTGSVAARRLVYMNYLLSAAAPPTGRAPDKDRLGLMMVPLFVGSHAYMAISHAIISGEKDPADEVEREGWPRNYHFFTDVSRHCIRQLRYRTRTAYKDQLGDQLCETFKTIIRTQQSLDYLPYRATQGEANRRLKLLCRVWPYQRIRIAFKQGVVTPGERDILIPGAEDEGIVLHFDMEPNPFYSGKEGVQAATQEYKFLPEQDVRAVLTAVWHRMGLILYREKQLRERAPEI